MWTLVIMASKSQKRKHKTLTMKEKNEIIERLSLNESYTSLASEYGVGRATIYDIKKNRDNILKFVSTDGDPSERQTLKKAKNPEVEEALYMWFRQERNRHTTISGPTLAKKAKFFYKEIMKRDDFVASKGWLERFKSRHGIRMTTGERVSNDTFKLRFLQKVKDLDLGPAQVYSADESGLFWRIIPSKTFVSQCDKLVPECMVSMERVTVMPCANAAGTHTLKMTVIGKTKKPRALRNIDLPVHYYGQNNACMTKDLFKNWFDTCFVPEVRKRLRDHNIPERALLLLDNAPGHPSEEELATDDKCITAMFLPLNCAALVQPMDHIIQFIKRDYKRKLLQTAISKDQPIQKTLTELNMKDLVFSLCQSWDALSPSAITSSWGNLWPGIVTAPEAIPQTISPSEVIQRVATETNISKGNLEEWCRGMDEEENVFHQMPDEEIIDRVLAPIDQEDEEDEGVATSSHVPAGDAINAFELGMQWAEENGASYNEILLLRKLRDKAVLVRLENAKQKKNYDY